MKKDEKKDLLYRLCGELRNIDADLKNVEEELKWIKSKAPCDNKCSELFVGCTEKRIDELEKKKVDLKEKEEKFFERYSFEKLKREDVLVNLKSDFKALKRVNEEVEKCYCELEDYFFGKEVLEHSIEKAHDYLKKNKKVSCKC